MNHSFTAAIRPLDTLVIIDMTGEIDAFADQEIHSAYTQAEGLNMPTIVLNFTQDTSSPVTVVQSTLFIQRAGKKIREMVFNGETGSYNAPDTTLLAEHITSPGLVEMSYQQEDDSIIWCVRTDGVMVSFTYNPAEEVTAFARHITDGLFKSVAVIPAPSGTTDQAWVIVERVINSVTKKYIKFFDDELYVDCGLTYSGAAVTTVTGLSHLEAKSVEINGDSAVYPGEVVSGGSVTLDGPDAEVIQIGLKYVPTMVTLKPEVKMANGTSQGRKKHWVEIFVRMYQSAGITIEGDEMPSRSAADPMDSAPPLYTGDQRVSNSGWSREAQLTFEHQQPLPSTILGYFGSLDVEGMSSE